MLEKVSGFAIQIFTGDMGMIWDAHVGCHIDLYIGLYMKFCLMQRNIYTFLLKNSFKSKSVVYRI